MSSARKMILGSAKGCRPMLRMSLPWFLEVVSAIDAIPSTMFQGNPARPSPYVFHNAKGQLEALFNQSIYATYLRASREQAGKLYAAIDVMLKLVDDPSSTITDFDIWSVSHERDQFKTIFLADISLLPSFLVAGKESYETNTLIDDGTKLFPSTLSKEVPEAVPDANEVGKALAFELATACGFHIFRVTEAVLKRYWDYVSSSAARPSLETLGSFAIEMEKRNFGDKKVTESIKQMARLHRNPLIHPEVILSVEEAIDTMGIARSVIGAMLRVLPDAPITTSSAVTVASATP